MDSGYEEWMLVTDMAALERVLVIVERKAHEERLAGYYWTRPIVEQERFLEVHGAPIPDAALDRRNLISHVLAGMSDRALGALARRLDTCDQQQGGG
jgi:hypothetical protein